MCGILLGLQPSAHINESFERVWERLKASNSARGPDAQECHTSCVAGSSGHDIDLRCFASELRLRGNSPVVQPHVEEGDVFCWNGEVFEGLDVSPSENDGVKLFRKIRDCAGDNFENGLLEVLRNIEGPYAFTYYRSTSKRLFFGRDPLGRRSLLFQRPLPENPILLLASVSYGYDSALNLEELPTEFIYYFDLAAITPVTDGYSIPLIGQLPRASTEDSSSDFATPRSVNKTLPPDQPPVTHDLSAIPPELTQPVQDFIAYLSRSVQLRVRDIPYHGEKGQARVAVLFSGGIDSTVIAYLAHLHLPEDEPIDLLNVAFENPRKNQTNIDEKSMRNGAKKKKQIRTSKSDNTEKSPISYRVPDRVTGLEELEEFNRLCPNRRWNFVEIDVPFDESTTARPIVESLMSPSRTVMDMSLGLALYFASKGEGYVRTTHSGDRYPYMSPARVLLNGLGSDELLGGYGRHRTAFVTGGWPAVIDELQLEIDRIPIRNLGRDDRVISSHGKEVRHPFLSLSVVNFLAGLPVQTKMDPRLPLGTGDKMLLRIASRKLGLDIASSRKKRAMQFGSHSARMEAGESEKRGDIILKMLE